MATIIGLTGGIASGKSTVTAMLRLKGFAVIDADAAARAAVEPGEEALAQISAAFGPDIMLPDGTLDRPKLGSIVFNNEEKRRQLNSIVHPAVRKKMADWQAEAVSTGRKTIFLDIPLLFESGLTHMVERIIVVYVNEETQLERLMNRNSLSEEEARARISSQQPLKDKVKMADAVIDNNGAVEDMKVQLEKILSEWGLKP